MTLLTGNLLMIALFMLIIHSVETLAYAVRLSGVRVRLLASALSLFNVMVMVARLSNMMQQPFTGSLIDKANGNLSFVEQQFRVLIGSASIGTMLGMLLLPTFIAIFSRAIVHLAAARGSVPTLMKKGLTPSYMRRAYGLIRLPRLSHIRGLGLRKMPMKLFWMNVTITAIYTIGVLCALYASLLVPEHRTTAIMASGLINGIATILLVIFIDPKISSMADEVMNKRGHYNDLKRVSVVMMSSRLVGTVAAQLLFIPGAYYVAMFATWLT